MMVGGGAGAEPRLEVRHERWLEQPDREAVGERVGEVLLPLRPVQRLAGTERMLERFLGRIDAEEPRRPGPVELDADGVAVGHRLREGLDRTVGLPPNADDRARVALAHREEGLSHGFAPVAVTTPAAGPYHRAEAPWIAASFGAE